MKLGALVAKAENLGLPATILGNPEVLVTGVSQDSRTVAKGNLFVAMSGTKTHGSAFVDRALEAGASCWAGQIDTATQGAVPIVSVEDPEGAAGLLAAAFHGDPASDLALVGITGTNGKTSTASILESIWKQAGVACGIAGTIGSRGPGFHEEAKLTTLPACELQAFLGRLRDSGAKVAALEVSSHALAQQRVAGCHFKVAIFTNLTRDHLDYHGDEDSYFRAKCLLFHKYLEPGAAAVLNVDDARVRGLAETLGGQPDACDLWDYSCARGSKARASVLEADLALSGIRARLNLDGQELAVRSRLVGLPNLSNMLAAAAAAAALGVDPAAISEGLSGCDPVPGRLESVRPGQPTVLVDYAHTPDALERMLEALGGDVRGRLICVFGCGGDRDRGKRPMMGRIAAEGADLAIVTSDNPRGEDPQRIVADIVAGMDGRPRLEERALDERSKGYVVEVDRGLAIDLAIATAGRDDVVVLAGKGHETYQEIDGVRLDFDDREKALAALARRETPSADHRGGNKK